MTNVFKGGDMVSPKKDFIPIDSEGSKKPTQIKDSKPLIVKACRINKSEGQCYLKFLGHTGWFDAGFFVPDSR